MILKNVKVKIDEFEVKFVIAELLYGNEKLEKLSKKIVIDKMKNMFETNGYIYMGGISPIQIYVSEITNHQYRKTIIDALTKECNDKVDLIYEKLFPELTIS